MEEFLQQTSDLLGIRLHRKQICALEKFENELLDWNSKFNLTALQNKQQIRVKHFLDSFTCYLVIRESRNLRIVDVGTGAGFPGLPLKIINPSIQLTLIESVGKKVQFCKHIVDVLGLEEVKIIHERVEVIGQSSEHRQQYDWAVARAVASLSTLVEYMLPLLKIGGSMVAMKGIDALAEAHTSEHAAGILGGHLRKLIPVTLPTVVEERYLVVMDKIAATPPVYPRRVGIPAKRPLK